MRRPSGEVSWLCRLQNGQLTSGPEDVALADITALLIAESTGRRTAEHERWKIIRIGVI